MKHAVVLTTQLNDHQSGETIHLHRQAAEALVSSGQARWPDRGTDRTVEVDTSALGMLKQKWGSRWRHHLGELLE